MVLKELIFNSFYYWAECGGLERTDFYPFLYWESMMFLK